MLPNLRNNAAADCQGPVSQYRAFENLSTIPYQRRRRYLFKMPEPNHEKKLKLGKNIFRIQIIRGIISNLILDDHMSKNKLSLDLKSFSY